MTDKQKIQNVLANKEKINWRIVGKLEAEMYKAQLIDTEDLIHAAAKLFLFETTKRHDGSNKS